MVGHLTGHRASELRVLTQRPEPDLIETALDDQHGAVPITRAADLHHQPIRHAIGYIVLSSEAR